MIVLPQEVIFVFCSGAVTVGDNEAQGLLDYYGIEAGVFILVGIKQ